MKFLNMNTKISFATARRRAELALKDRLVTRMDQFMGLKAQSQTGRLKMIASTKLPLNCWTA